ncbi:hypothetical protein D3C75_1123060 [compost metagenome]
MQGRGRTAFNDAIADGAFDLRMELVQFMEHPPIESDIHVEEFRLSQIGLHPSAGA